MNAVKTAVLSDPLLATRLDAVFGGPDDPMSIVERRAIEMFPDANVIVWEGDPQTFQFSYVGKTAETILGYPSRRWTTEPTFWGDTVVHADDRHDAIAYCALATGKGQDHDFVYRAVRADGSVVHLHDVVKVIVGGKGVAVKLRGIMVEIPELPGGKGAAENR